jgi:hypothetical protein
MMSNPLLKYGRIFYSPKSILFPYSAALLSALSSSAAFVAIEDWQMNEASAGVTMDSLANSAGSINWPTTGSHLATDGSGALRYVQGSNQYKSLGLTTPNVTSGQYELSFKINAATIGGGDVAGARVGFGFRDEVGTDLFHVRLHRTNNELRLQVIDTAGTVDLYDFNAISLPDTLTIRAVVDLDAPSGQLDIYYTIGSEAEQSSLGRDLVAGQFDQLRMTAQLISTDFGASDFVEIDYVTLKEEVVGTTPLTPEFSRDLVLKAPAFLGATYSEALIGSGVDQDYYFAVGDLPTFTKTAGPAWLSVGLNDGALTGTPGASDVGINSFTLQIIAAISGSTDTVTMEIEVLKPAALPFSQTGELRDSWDHFRAAPGWSTAEWHAPSVRPETYTYAGTLPVSGLAHTKTIDVNGVAKIFTGAQLLHDSILVDAMVQVALRTDTTDPEVAVDKQAAFYFDASGQLVVHHTIYTPLSAQQWTTVSNAAVSNGDLVRLTILADFTSDTSAPTDRYFSVALDGVPLTDAAAYLDPADASPDPSGVWFICANSGDGNGSITVNGVSFDGLARIDDLNVSAPTAVTAQGTPHEWVEQYYPGVDYAAYDLLDTDGDGKTTAEEFGDGSNPTSSASVVRAVGSFEAGGAFRVTWPSYTAGALTPYQMYRSLDLSLPLGGWVLVGSNIQREPSGTITWEDQTPPSSSAFYRFEN